MKELATKAIEEIKPLLSNYGMEISNKNNNVFMSELADGIYGWVSLNTITQKTNNVLAINPLIGNRNEKIEKIVIELTDNKLDKGITPTIMVNIGYLKPVKDYRTYNIKKTNDIPIVMKKLVNDIVKYGIKFINDNISLEKLSKTMSSSGYGWPQLIMYRLPICYFLLGNKHLSEKAINDELKKLSNRDDIAAQDYRKFSQKLLDIINKDI